MIDNWGTWLMAIFSTGAIAVAQVPNDKVSSGKSSRSAPIEQQELRRRLKLTLTLTSLDDLRVKEGDRVGKDGILADKDRDRKRLEANKKATLMAIAKIEQTPLPVLQPAPPVTNLPVISYAEEEAAVQAAELKFTQAQRTLQQALSNDPFITAKAQVDKAKSEVELAYRKVELAQRKLDTIRGLKSLPPEMITHETERLKAITSEWEGKQAEYEFKLAEYQQVESSRKAEIARLTDGIELARSQLEVSQARLRAAKEARNTEEYQHRITVARRAEEENQAQISLSNQKLNREFKLAQLRENLNNVEEKLNAIAVVRSPVAGSIKRVRVNAQTDNTISVTVSIIPDNPLNSYGSSRSAITPKIERESKFWIEQQDIDISSE